MKSANSVFVMMISFMMIYRSTAYAQGLQNNSAAATISSHHLELSDNKTTNIIFPYAVKSVDRGSGDIIAQLVQGFGNVLQLKANVQGFKQTNITVITSDGKFYSFLVDYDPNPKALNLSFVQSNERNDAAPALADDYNDAALDSDAANVLHAKAFLHKGIINEQMRLRLAGIYLKDGLMWFKLRLRNGSQVTYETDQISFSIIDKKQVKRTARQEISLQPVYARSAAIIQDNATKEMILAFKPLTLAKTKLLKIVVSEKAGGRNLVLTFQARKLLRAKVLK